MAQKFVDFWYSAVTVVTEKSSEILIGLAIFILFFILSKQLEKMSAKIFEKIFKKDEELRDGVHNAFIGPSKIFFRLLGFYLGALVVKFPKGTMSTITTFVRIGTIVVICWVIADFMPVITSKMVKNKKTANNGRRTSAVAVQFLANIFKGIVFAIGAVIIISELGYNINGLIAGIGLSGLTFSLAAQKTATNLFGGFAIITDRPFDVGDRITTPSVDGVVEDITMRSTRIRTFGDTVVVVPNSVLIEEPITNWAKMNKRMVDFKIGLIYDTSTKTLKRVCNKIENMLKENEQINDDLISVQFDGFNDSSVDIRIIYFTNVTGYEDYLRVKADCNYKIKNIVEKEDTDFAFPTTTILMENQQES